jgi:AcrR family transcriptional regulator
MARLTREQSRAITRQKLLRSALDVVARDGYDGASVERIAEEAGFSKGAFYSNFTTKEDILLELLESNAGRDVRELSELLADVSDPDEVVEVIARWSDNRTAEPSWGLIAIEFLRRAQRDGTLGERQRHLFTSQWEEVGALVLNKLFDGDAPPIKPVDIGGIILNLTYGGIESFLEVNTAGQMIREILNAFRNAHQLTSRR